MSFEQFEPYNNEETVKFKGLKNLIIKDIENFIESIN